MQRPTAVTLSMTERFALTELALIATVAFAGGIDAQEKKASSDPTPGAFAEYEVRFVHADCA